MTSAQFAVAAEIELLEIHSSLYLVCLASAWAEVKRKRKQSMGKSTSRQKQNDLRQKKNLRDKNKNTPKKIP